MPDWIDRVLYPRPAEDRVHATRTPLADTPCPSCGGGHVSRYPIANHLGPRITITCQDCLHVLAIERPRAEDMWPPYRAVAYDWDPSPAERAARTLMHHRNGGERA